MKSKILVGGQREGYFDNNWLMRSQPWKMISREEKNMIKGLGIGKSLAGFRNCQFCLACSKPGRRWQEMSLGRQIEL